MKNPWLVALIALAVVLNGAFLVLTYANSHHPGRLITVAESGATEALARLEEKGEAGKLGPYSDRLGAILASRLEAMWKPLIDSHAYEHPADEMAALPFPESTQSTGLPLDDLTATWAKLFLLSEPKVNAREETWRQIGQATLHLHIKPEVRYNPSRELPVTIVIYNALDGLNDPQQGLTFGFMIDEVRIGGVRAVTAVEETYGSSLPFVSADRAGFPPSDRHGLRQPYFVWQENWIPASEAHALDVEADARIEFLDGDETVCAWAETIRQQIGVIPR